MSAAAVAGESAVSAFDLTGMQTGLTAGGAGGAGGSGDGGEERRGGDDKIGGVESEESEENEENEESDESVEEEEKRAETAPAKGHQRFHRPSKAEIAAMTPEDAAAATQKKRDGERRRRKTKHETIQRLKKENEELKERMEKEKKEREEREKSAGAAQPRSGTWRGRGNSRPPVRGYGFRFATRQPYRPFPPSPHQASPAAPPAEPAPPAASPSGLLANPSTGPSLPQQPQGAVLGKSKIQKSEKPKTEKKKKDAEKKKREAERLEREKKREEKERREEEERREMREEEREERRREREEERRRDEERRREEREGEDRRHRQFLEMLAAQENARSAEAARQEAARSAEALRQEAARATQAERERTLASLSTLGAAAEQRFGSLRSGYLEARGRETSEQMWSQYNLAVNYCDRFLSQLYNWRSSVVTEVGSTPESALTVRLSAIENEASVVLREAPRITAPTPAPQPSLLPAPSQVGGSQYAATIHQPGLLMAPPSQVGGSQYYAATNQQPGLLMPPPSQVGGSQYYAATTHQPGLLMPPPSEVGSQQSHAATMGPTERDGVQRWVKDVENEEMTDVGDEPPV